MSHSEFYYTRKILSWLCFLAAIVCLIIFFVQGMENLLWIIASLILFIIAYFISPHNKKHDDKAELLFDEVIIEAIYYLIVFPLRIVIKGIQHILD